MEKMRMVYYGQLINDASERCLDVLLDVKYSDLPEEIRAEVCQLEKDMRDMVRRLGRLRVMTVRFKNGEEDIRCLCDRA